MIYTAVRVKGASTQHNAFTQRSLNGLTQAKMSDVPLVGRRDENQLAYDGYKANIEAFLYATATGRKVPTGRDDYTLPTSKHIINLPLPRIVFRLARKPTPDNLLKMKAKLEPYGLQELAIGKGDPVYTLQRPTLKHMTTILPGIASPAAPSVEGYCTVESAFWASKIYHIIGLFLATNTYPYSRDEDNDEGMQVDGIQLTSGEKRGSIWGRVDDLGARGKKPRFMDGVREGEEMDAGLVDDDLWQDMEDALTEIKEAVLSAKPSPHMPSISSGPPSSVPLLPGHVFPYFDGLLAPDVPFVRSFLGTYFVRNLATDTLNPKEGFKAMRSSISTFVHTPEGVMISHVLKGIELALECQGWLYLLMDGDKYLGFCLLGGKYHLFNDGTWVAPLEASIVQQQLDEIQTHEGILGLILLQLKKLDFTKKEKSKLLRFEDIDTALKLGQTLGQVLWEKVDLDSSDYDDLVYNLKRLSYPTQYKKFSPKNIAWAVEEMTVRLAEPLDPSTQIYMPSERLSNFVRKEYHVLLAFGPRAPSFRATTGAEFLIAKPDETDPFSKIDEKTKKLEMGKMIIGEKLPHVALAEWDQVVRSRKVRFEPNERAAGSRNRVFVGENRDVIWKALRDQAKAGFFGNKANGEEGASSSRKRPMEFGAADFDDIFD